MKNLELIETLIEGVANKDHTKVAQAFKDLQELIIIEQYYLLKGFKTAKRALFMDSISLAPTEGKHACKVIIKNLYGTEEENVLAAYNGMGNLDAYVTEINKMKG